MVYTAMKLGYNPSLLLSLTVKIKKYRSCHLPRFLSYLRASADRRQNVRFGHNYDSPVMFCAPPTLSFCPCRRSLPPSIINWWTIAFCQSVRFPLLRNKGRRQRQPSPSSPLIVYPLHHAQSKIQVVTTIVLFLSLHTVRVGSPPPPIS